MWYVCVLYMFMYERTHVDVGVFVCVLKTYSCVWMQVCVMCIFICVCTKTYGYKVCAHVHMDAGVCYVYIMCVCPCAHGCKVLCAHTCTHEGKAQWAPGIFLCRSPPYFSRQGFSLDLEFTDSTGQAEPRAPGIHLPPLPQGAPGIHPALLPQCCCYRCVLHLSNMGSQDQNSCPHSTRHFAN